MKSTCARVALISTFLFATVIASSAQTFTSLASFNQFNGFNPNGSLIQGTDGNFYGVTPEGTIYNGGTIFGVTPEGQLADVYDFCQQPNCTDGMEPLAGLTLGTDGNIYGTTIYGGANNQGEVFVLSPTHKLTVLHSFCNEANCADGADPWASLIQASDGNFYGTTFYGGTGTCTYPEHNGCGIVFRITPTGVFTILHSFSEAEGHQTPSLTQAADGNLYGTTNGSSDDPSGTIFQITLGGKEQSVYQFVCEPRNCFHGNSASSLIQGNDGNGYGVTPDGRGFTAYGTIFKITPTAKLTTAYVFHSTDGSTPVALTQATDGNFYGVAAEGGMTGTAGTIFSITPAGDFSTLYFFCTQAHCADGQQPETLLQATSGIFYGTTYYGGTDSDGTIFSLNTGLGPFVAFVNRFGPVGQGVKILGQGFAGTTSVSFNGTPANFKVNSDTLLTAVVPTGATSGVVTVETPSGTLTSNKTFIVIP